MEIITLPRLKNAELQTIAGSSLEICEPLHVLKPYVETVVKIYDPYKEGMLKEQASGEEKKVLDRIRDRLVVGFFKAVSAETYFPYESAAVYAVIEQLRRLNEKYGGAVARLPLNEETSTIDNFVEEFEKLDLSVLPNDNLTRWIPLIVGSNSNFKHASKEYIVDTVDVSDTESATSLAPELIEALEAMYTMLFANIKVINDAKLIKAHAQLTELVNSYR